jgi:hypothetical protein
MSKGGSGFLGQADRVLKLLMDERVAERSTGHPGELSAREIMETLGITWDQYTQLAEYLCEMDYTRCSLGGLDALMSVTGKGIEFYKRRHDALPLHIAWNVGAIYQGSVQATQIQSVASAVHSSVQQVVEGAEVEDIRQAITQTIENMVRSVQSELTVEELAVYARVASESKQEIARENPDKGRLWRALPVLSILGDMEGTIQLAERAFTLASHVAPYVPFLVTFLVRLFSRS